MEIILKVDSNKAVELQDIFDIVLKEDEQLFANFGFESYPNSPVTATANFYRFNQTYSVPLENKRCLVPVEVVKTGEFDVSVTYDGSTGASATVSIETEVTLVEYDDSITDYTSIIQQKINDGTSILFEEGLYRVGELTLKDNITIDFGGSTIKLLNGQGTNVSVFKATNNTNITLLNGTIDGNRENMSGQSGNNNNCLVLIGCSNFFAKNMSFVNANYDGAIIADYVTSTSRIDCQNLRFEDCVFNNNTRQGSSVFAVDGLEFIRCSFTNTHGIQPESGIDFEPGLAAEIKNIRIIDCVSSGNNGKGIIFDLSAKEYNDVVYIENYVGYDNGLSGRYFSHMDLSFQGDEATVYSGIVINDSKISAFYLSQSPQVNSLHINNSELGAMRFGGHHGFKVTDSTIRQIIMESSPWSSVPRFVAYTEFDNCTFDGVATEEEAAVGVAVAYTYATFANITYRNCLFKRYTGDSALYYVYDSTFIDCTFTDNFSPTQGYRVLDLKISEGANNTKLIRCNFLDNNGKRLFKLKPDQGTEVVEGIIAVNCISNDYVFPTPTTTNNKIVACVKI